MRVWWCVCVQGGEGARVLVSGVCARECVFALVLVLVFARVRVCVYVCTVAVNLSKYFFIYV